MMSLVDVASPVCLVRGATRPVELLASETVGNGTLGIVARDGLTVATATVTAGAASVTVGGSVDVGAEYLAVWAVTIGGESRIVTQYCVIAAADLSLPPIVSETVETVTGMAPASGSSWEGVIRAAWARVLLDLRRLWPAIRSGVLESPAALAQVTVHAAEALAYRQAGAYTGGVARDWYDDAERLYRAAWADLMLPVDTDGDGVADTDPVRAQMAAFPPPSPASRR